MAALATAVGTALSLGACAGNAGGSATPAESGSPSATASRSATPRDAAQAGALASYRGMIDAWAEAAETADTEAPALREHASGEALKTLTTDLFVARQEGRVARGKPVVNPVIAEVKPTDAPTEVTITDCLDGRDWLSYKTTGELWDNEPGGLHAVNAVVRRSGGVWKVDFLVVGGSGTC